MPCWLEANLQNNFCRFKAFARNLTCIQVNTSTEQTSLEDKESLYKQLEKTCWNANIGDIKLLSDDLDAKVSNNNTTLIGRRCYTISALKHTQMYLDLSRRRFWSNQIDHFAINRRWRGSLQNEINYKGGEIYSILTIIYLLVKSA